MKVLYPGHQYLLDNLDSVDPEMSGHFLQFVQRAPLHEPRAGTTNQEVCRALIDRVKVLDAEETWWGNDAIIENLRSVIYLHELRAYEKKVTKLGRNPQKMGVRARVGTWLTSHGYSPEAAPVGDDGHWTIPLPEKR